MQYFKNASDRVFAFDDDVTMEVIESIHGVGVLTSITKAEADTLLLPSDAQQLTDAKNKKVNEFSILCGDKISTGFTSDALGTNNAYRCNTNDQAKMRVAKESLTGGKIWVGEVFTLHTQAQAQIVYDLAMAHVDSVTSEYSDKYAEVQLASTVAEVDAITWTDS